jgi:hypothetical protein
MANHSHIQKENPALSFHLTCSDLHMRWPLTRRFFPSVARAFPDEPKTVIYPVRQIPAVFDSRRVSPVALVYPVVVSLVVAVLAVLRVVAASPVLALRWFSFVQ